MPNHITIAETPAFFLFAAPCQGVQNIANAYSTIIAWASEEGILDSSSQMCTVYLDSFRTTPPSEVRMLAGLISSSPLVPKEPIKTRTIEGGRHIIGSYTISPHDFGKEWALLFMWMKDNGHQWNQNPPFEIYHNDFRTHPEGLAKVDFYIPIL